MHYLLLAAILVGSAKSNALVIGHATLVSSRIESVSQGTAAKSDTLSRVYIRCFCLASDLVTNACANEDTSSDFALVFELRRHPQGPNSGNCLVGASPDALPSESDEHSTDRSWDPTLLSAARREIGPDGHNVSLDSVDLASGPALHTHLRSLVEEHTRRNADTDHISSYDDYSGGRETECAGPEDVAWDDTMSVFSSKYMAEDVSATESFRLHHLFIRYMGVTQHFLDDRAFVDNLILFFRSPRSQSQLRGSLWYLQYLLILAMGKLLDDTPGATLPPGAEYFAEALRRLPPLHELGAYGAIGVEILALIATYLQWVGKKQDAYLYVGSGVRLAVALGFAQPQVKLHRLPSEAAHQTRLFWTLYMLDRRLSSALGLPVGVNDRQVKIETPWHSPGFESPVPMCINIKIAQITGKIMDCLYGNIAMSREEHVTNVENIMNDLRCIPSMMPKEYRIDFNAKDLIVTRTGASLYLMCNQAVLLCLRPMTLQQVRLKVAGKEEILSDRMKETTSKLVQLGRDAALKSISLLSALQSENLLARFGFFDMDATFSAAFILVMIAILNGTTTETLPEEVRLACDVLLYLGKAGNQVAKDRLDDISRFCASVWRTSESSTLSGDTHASKSCPSSPPPEYGQVFENIAAGANAADNTYFQTLSGLSDTQGQTGSSHDRSDSPTVASLQPPAAGETSGLDFFDEAQCIYTGFDVPDFSLTGFDHGDWMEMEKLLADYL
ncbi:hypothetical protein Q7P37_010369 [Cladosporium fusiforme]